MKNEEKGCSATVRNEKTTEMILKFLEEQQTFKSWVSSGSLDEYWLLPCLRGLQSLQLLTLSTLGIPHGWHNIDIIAVDFRAWSEPVMILLTWGSACWNQQGLACGKGYVNSWKSEVVCFFVNVKQRGIVFGNERSSRE